MTGLERLVIDLRSGELVVRVLYRSEDGPNPGTKARRREVEDLVRTGLRQALASLDAGDVSVVGVSGFTTREDILSIASSSAMTTPAIPSSVRQKGKT